MREKRGEYYVSVEVCHDRHERGTITGSDICHAFFIRGNEGKMKTFFTEREAVEFAEGLARTPEDGW